MYVPVFHEKKLIENTDGKYKTIAIIPVYKSWNFHGMTLFWNLYDVQHVHPMKLRVIDQYKRTISEVQSNKIGYNELSMDWVSTPYIKVQIAYQDHNKWDLFSSNPKPSIMGMGIIMT